MKIYAGQWIRARLMRTLQFCKDCLKTRLSWRFPTILYGHMEMSGLYYNCTNERYFLYFIIVNLFQIISILNYTYFELPNDILWRSVFSSNFCMFILLRHHHQLFLLKPFIIPCPFELNIVTQTITLNIKYFHSNEP